MAQADETSSPHPAPQEQAEDALRKSEERLRIAKEADRIGVYDWDVVTGEILWDERIRELWDVGTDTPVTYDLFLAGLHPDDRASLQAAVNRALDPSGAGHYNAEYRIVGLGNGIERWIEATGKVLFDGDRPARMVGLARDVTGRKRTEEALRVSECRERERSAELAALLDAVPMPVFIAHDPACLHISGNRAADELLGNPRGGEASLTAPVDRRPGHFRVIKDGRELQNEELPAQRAARGEPVQDFELSVVFDEGRTCDVLAYATPLLEEQGQPRGSVLVLVDITERKRVSEALSAAYQQVRELAARLQSIREEERARISREIHDELTQNLTAMRIGLIGLGKRLGTESGSLEETVRESVALVESTLGTVRKIASDLRPAVLDALGLGAALKWQSEEFQRKMGISCLVELETDLPRAERERSTALFRIFQEALNNVAQHAAATEVRARLWWEGRTLCLKIQDNGRGFPEARESGRKALGLLGMRERAAGLGGTVEISRHEGGGTRVLVRIPLTQVKSGGRRRRSG